MHSLTHSPAARLTYAAGAALLTAVAARGLPIDFYQITDPHLDEWLLRDVFAAEEEIGVGFPPAELISAQLVPWGGHVPAPTTYSGNSANMQQVQITNLTGVTFPVLYYVADGWAGNPVTTITNWDEYLGQIKLFNGLEPPPAGTIGAAWLAFRIDAVGENTPLVSESLTADGRFEAGETWEFVVQDYTNSQSISAAALGSYFDMLPNNPIEGRIAEFSAGPTTEASSGSIVIPEPAAGGLAGALVAVALAAAATRRREG